MTPLRTKKLNFLRGLILPGKNILSSSFSTIREVKFAFVTFAFASPTTGIEILLIFKTSLKEFACPLPPSTTNTSGKSPYFNLLDKDGIYKEEFSKNAIRFGYCYYFKRQFYLPLLDQGKFTFQNMNDLEKGRVPNFKKFIQCILENEDFINDEDIIKKYLL